MLTSQVIVITQDEYDIFVIMHMNQLLTCLLPKGVYANQCLPLCNNKRWLLVA